MKKKHTKYTHINTDKYMHSIMGSLDETFQAIYCNGCDRGTPYGIFVEIQLL